MKKEQEKKTINIRTIYCRKQIFTKELPVLDIQLYWVPYERHTI